MLIGLVFSLAAAAPLPPDQYYDELGCKWKRRPPVAAKPASGPKQARRPVVKSSKPKPVKAKPEEEADEFIGCDTEGFGVWRSDLEGPSVPMITAETFEAVLEIAEPSLIAATVPPTFAEVCECSTNPTYAYPPSYGGSWSGWTAPPSTFPTPPPIATPIPELPIWAMTLGGLVMLSSLKRRK